MSHYNFIIPYRNLPNCLEIFKQKFPEYLKTQTYIDTYNIVIVEQEQGKLFNLAKLINVGFDYCKKSLPYNTTDVIVFHPIDAIPLSGSYEVPENSCVMYCEHDQGMIDRGDHIAGKAHGFRNNVFERVNGYSNEYWGWGHEDDDMIIRLNVNNIPIFGTFFNFDFLMEHQGGTQMRNNVDKPVHDISNWSKSDEIYMKMKQDKNFSTSGLNNLSYALLDKKENENIFHIIVSI